MIGIGNDCFIQIPSDSKKRVLYPFLVIEVSNEHITLESQENGIPVTSPSDILLYFEQRREFMQQAARVEAVEEREIEDDGTADDGPRIHITLVTTGDPVSAESRQVYRVTTALADYEAKINDEACPVLDVSSTGLSVVSHESYTVGKVVSVSLSEHGEAYNGDVSVQSVRDLGNGRTRYGLHCSDNKRGAGTLAEGLHQASMRFQREQLQRVAGVA